MLKKLMNMKKKKGFTLIELIVVLVIMAILAAAAIPTMMGYVEKARSSQYLAEGRAVYVAAQAGATEGYGKGGEPANNVAIIETKISDAAPAEPATTATADQKMVYYVKYAIKDVCKDTEMVKNGSYAVEIDKTGTVTKVEYKTGDYLVTINPHGDATSVKGGDFTITTAAPATP